MFEASISGEEFDNPKVKEVLDYFVSWYRVMPVLSLREDLEKRLKDRGIILNTVVQDEEIPKPLDLVKRNLELDKELNTRFLKDCETIQSYH